MNISNKIELLIHGSSTSRILIHSRKQVYLHAVPLRDMLKGSKVSELDIYIVACKSHYFEKGKSTNKYDSKVNLKLS